MLIGRVGGQVADGAVARAVSAEECGVWGNRELAAVARSLFLILCVR